MSNNMKKPTKNRALTKAIELVGSQSILARLCKVSQQTVYYWLTHKVPPHRVLTIEKVTKGEVTRYELRPDVYTKE